MARSNEIAAQLLGALQESAEFHTAIAFDAWVGSVPRFVFFHKGTHDLIFELCRIIEHVMRNAQAECHIARIFDVVEAATGMAVVIDGIVVVELHRGANAFIALTLQQIRRYARIDAAAHRDKNASLGFRHIRPSCRFRSLMSSHRSLRLSGWVGRNRRRSYPPFIST